MHLNGSQATGAGESLRQGMAGRRSRDDTAYRPLRCRGDASFASPLAADVARLLDVDGAVDHWRCGVLAGLDGQLADFATYGSRGEEFVFVRPVDPPAGLAGGFELPKNARLLGSGDLDPVRLENARAILPFARWRVSLDDRVRLLTVLDEEGSVTLAECLGIFRNTSRPVAAVAALALARIVDMELDEPIGARTRITRRGS